MNKFNRLSNGYKTVILAFTFIFYTVLFFLLFDLTDQRISALTILPIIAASLFFGMRAGIVTSLVIIPINTFYLKLMNMPAVNVMLENIPGVIGSIAIAAALGYLHDLQKKSKEQLKVIEKEIYERKKAEEKLFVIQNNFNSKILNKNNQIDLADGLNINSQIYRVIAENAADIIYSINLEGYFTYVNKMGLSSTYFSEKEILKKNYLDLVVPSYKEKVRQFYFRQYLKKELNSYFEFPFKVKDGSIKWFGQNATIIFEGSKITGFSVIARDITDRKKIEDALKKNEEILRSITYTANDAIISIDRNFNIVQWNRMAERMYGYDESEILGKSLLIITPPSEREQLEKVRMRFNPMKGIEPSKTIERNGLRKGEIIFPVEISIAQWNLNSEVFFTLIIRDVSERKETERKIQNSEKDYRTLFENAQEPILIISPKDEVVLEANKSACETYGFEHSEFVGMSLKKLSKNIHRGEEKISETLQNGYFIKFKTTQYNKEGKELYFEVNASVIEYKGEIVILSFNRDVTERVLNERQIDEYKNQLEKLVLERTEKLEEANQKLSNEIQKLTEADLKIKNQIDFFKTLINTIPIPVFVMDRNNHCSDRNKAFLEFFGENKEEFLNKNINTLKPFEKNNNESFHSCETNIINKEGIVHEVILYKAGIIGENEISDGWVGVILDISQHKKMQEEIKKALEAEKELNNLRSKFVSTASHEFRTPLTSILASAELLLRYYDRWDDEKKLNALKRIQNSADYMNGLISDVLTLNKSESGRIKFNPEYLELISLCSIIIEEVKLIAKPEHQIEFIHQEKNIYGNFDGILIRQLLNNLLSNAIKYSPDGGKVKLSIKDKDSEVLFEVQDEGIGITKDDQEKLFQPFYRGTNISNISGTGLGLSILKKAVDLHNGRVEFKSKLNEGTIFKVAIPKQSVPVSP